MDPNYFVVVERGEKKELTYFGGDANEASEAYEKAIKDDSVDLVRIYNNPPAGNRSNPKQAFEYWRAEEAKNKAAIEAEKNAEKIAAEAQISAAKAAIVEASKTLKALKADE